MMLVFLLARPFNAYGLGAQTLQVVLIDLYTEPLTTQGACFTPDTKGDIFRCHIFLQ